MKTTKLCTFLLACLLIAPLGGCSLKDYSDVLEVNNYTLSFQLVDENDKKTTIPDYASIYIIGDWNNYASFTQLEQSRGRYKTNIPSISVATHEFKLVLTYSDLDISWSNAREITPTYQTFEVDPSKGNNYTNKITITYDMYFPSISEVISNLDNELSKYSKGSDLGYDAYSYVNYTKESEKTDTYYLTYDTNNDIYGTLVEENGSSITYNYFKGGRKYTNSDGSLSYTSFNEEYTYPLESFTKPFSITSIDSYEYTLTVKSDSYLLEIFDSGDAYTYTFDLDYSLNEINYKDSQSNSYNLKEVSVSEVEKRMDDFNQYDYVEPTSITELVEKAVLCCNYSVEITYNTYLSEERMTYEEYLEDESAASKTLVNSDRYLKDSYIIDIYYDLDYILIVQYHLEEDEYELYTVEFLVNEDGTCWDYYIDNIEYFYWYYDYLYSNSWYDYVYYLGDIYESDTLTYLAEDSNYSNDEYIAYYFTDNVAKANWFACIGTCFMFYDPFTYGYSYFVHSGTYYSNNKQEIISNFYNDGLSWDGTLTLESEIYFMDNELTAKIYDVGITDKSDVVNYYHNYFQQYVEIW